MLNSKWSVINTHILALIFLLTTNLSWITNAHATDFPHTATNRTTSNNDTPSNTLSATHYLIPGFSNHLLEYGRLVYYDLINAERAAAAKRLLNMRISLANANGHLLQMGTPPELSQLRNQLISIQQSLLSQKIGRAVSEWETLKNMIRNLPMHRADQSARHRLLDSANQGLSATLKNQFRPAFRDNHILIREIEIPSSVFPIQKLRNIVNQAVNNAASFNPNWKALVTQIKRAKSMVHWLSTPNASRDIHGYDALIAAYVAFPENSAYARLQLKHAAWWLGLSHHHRALRRKILTAAHSSSLNLKMIDKLQTQLASMIKPEHGQYP